jgi:S-adenosyl methyltransferase
MRRDAAYGGAAAGAARGFMTTPIDTTTPNVARMYDYWLGGKDNFEVDRKAAEAIREMRPNVAEQALDNKKFQTRAVTYVAGLGIRQFVDLGSGLPTSPIQEWGQPPLWLSTHEAAGGIVDDPVVAYVDYDPVAVRHSRAMLASGSSRVVAVTADMRDAEKIFAHAHIREAGFRPDQPACVILGCVLHFVDATTARGIVAALAGALASGSYLIISVGFGAGRAGSEFASTYNAQDGPRIYAHSWDQIMAMFDGLDLVPPGVVDVSVWRPEGREVRPTQRSNMIVGGVGRRP